MVCRDKYVFVATKILVAAPANDNTAIQVTIPADTTTNSLDDAPVVVDVDSAVPGQGDGGVSEGQRGTVVGQQHGVVGRHQVRGQQVGALGRAWNCAVFSTVAEMV